MPVKMEKPQAVVMGEKVYVGGGLTESFDNYNQVFQYDPLRNEWSRLAPHYVLAFAMAQFMGKLITVGGLIQDSVATSNKVHCFNEPSQKWEEFLTPMPTARAGLSVATTQYAIVASGGIISSKDMTCATVEVYSSETSQWYTADPLPVLCRDMTSVTIADTWYQLGGYGDDKPTPTVLYAPLTDLIQKAILSTHTHQSACPKTVWKTLPDTPLKESAAASVNGNLLTVGARKKETGTSPAVYIFLPLTNSWVSVTTGDLPEPRFACTAVQLSSNQLLVVGGRDNQNKCTKTVFLGSMHHHLEQ